MRPRLKSTQQIREIVYAIRNERQRIREEPEGELRNDQADVEGDSYAESERGSVPVVAFKRVRPTGELLVYDFFGKPKGPAGAPSRLTINLFVASWLSRMHPVRIIRSHGT
jgi:hypothetical protein